MSLLLDPSQLGQFYNAQGKIRLELVRSQLLAIEGQEPDLETLRYLYRQWRDTAEGLVLQKQTWHSDGSCDLKTFWSKCSKRGNDKYTLRNQKRISTFELRGDTEVTFFDFTKAHGRAYILFVTLTSDTKLGTLTECWQERIAQNWNRWITRLRRHYGCKVIDETTGKRKTIPAKIDVFRVWESTKRGYPHVHAMLVFHDREFKVDRHFGKCSEKCSANCKNPHVTWRVSAEDNEEFHKSWPSMIVDVQAPRTYSAIIRYLGKRILKGTDKTGFDEASLNEALEDGDLTMAMMWLFRKRSFALSRDLQKSMMDKLQRVADLIALKRNSNPVTLSPNGDRVIWVVLGIFSPGEVGLEGNDWYSEIDWPSLGLEPRMSRAYMESVSKRLFELRSGSSRREQPEPEVDYGRWGAEG